MNLKFESAGKAGVIARGGAAGAKVSFPIKAGLTFAALILAGSFAAQAQTLPKTQAEIEAAMRALANAGGGRVVVAAGVIDVVELRVPSKVTLVGNGPLGTYNTTLRLKAGTNGRVLMVGFGTANNAIENIIIDGNRKNQSPDTYIAPAGVQPVARPAALTLACTNCAARNVKVINAMYDAVQLSAAQNVMLSKVVISVAGNNGFFTTGSATAVKVHHSTAQDTGVAWRTVGGGAGFSATGTDVEFRYLTTRRTNGDGVAAYASNNLNIRVLDSIFHSPKNHCVHLGGDNAVIARNKCYSPRLVGFFIANNWRPGYEAERDAKGGRILDNYVEKAGSDGIDVQWYIADTIVRGNSVNRSFSNSFGIYDSRGVLVTENIARWPADGRPANILTWCHVKTTNSQVALSNNDFEYKKVAPVPSPASDPFEVSARFPSSRRGPKHSILLN